MFLNVTSNEMFAPLTYAIDVENWFTSYIILILLLISTEF